MAIDDIITSIGSIQEKVENKFCTKSPSCDSCPFNEEDDCIAYLLREALLDLQSAKNELTDLSSTIENIADEINQMI